MIPWLAGFVWCCFCLFACLLAWLVLLLLLLLIIWGLFDFFFAFCFCFCFACMSVWGCQITWHHSYRHLWTAMWILETEPGTSRRAASALDLWAISPTPSLKKKKKNENVYNIFWPRFPFPHLSDPLHGPSHPTPGLLPLFLFRKQTGKLKRQTNHHLTNKRTVKSTRNTHTKQTNKQKNIKIQNQKPYMQVKDEKGFFF